MTYTKMAAGIWVVVLLNAPVCGAPDALKADIDKIVQPVVEGKKPFGVAVGIVSKEGRRVFGYGAVAREGGTVPDGETIFEIGSITKVFTGLLLADMVEDGLVKFDDPVRRYLPDSVEVPTSGGKEITLLDLATHSSGLPRMPSNFALSKSKSPRDPYRYYTSQLLYDFLSKHRLRRHVGARFEYSNLGFGLLGHALVRRADMSYEELVVTRICEPLDMRDTRIGLSVEQHRRLALGHNSKGELAPNWAFDVIAGAGALRSSVNDMVKFLSANLGRTKTDLASAMETSHWPRRRAHSWSQQIGLGFHILSPAHSDVKVIWHNGETGGYHSYMGFVKSAGTGVIVLTNRATSIDTESVKILKLLTEGWN